MALSGSLFTDVTRGTALSIFLLTRGSVEQRHQCRYHYG